MPLSKNEMQELRHPTETPRFYITLFVLIPFGFVTALLTVATFGTILLLVPIILFSLWFSLRLAVAHWMNNFVRVSAASFPEANDAIKEAKELFGYNRTVEAYVHEDGSYNASILSLLNTKILLLNSELLRNENTKDELRFIVGRFVGALAAKHFRFGWLQFFINSVEKLLIFNILLFPYERATKLSGDRMGLRMIDGNTRVAVRSMMKMAVGSEIADRVNIRAYVAQGRKYNGSFFGWLARAFSSFPHHCTRVSELIVFAKQKYPRSVSASRGRARKRRVSGARMAT